MVRFDRVGLVPLCLEIRASPVTAATLEFLPDRERMPDSVSIVNKYRAQREILKSCAEQDARARFSFISVNTVFAAETKFVDFFMTYTCYSSCTFSAWYLLCYKPDLSEVWRFELTSSGVMV